MTANSYGKVKDMIAAESISKLLEFGYFDTAFIQYGAAYWKNGTAHYAICDDSVELYNHIHSLGNEEKYSTPILTFSRDMHVPMGMKEVYDSKLRAVNIKDLKRRIPEQYFEILRTIPLDSQDAAVKILEPIQESVVGRSHKVYLNIFQSLVEFARECHQLTYETYAQYLEWIEKERAFIVQRITKGGRFSTQYYGFLYGTNENDAKLFATATEAGMLRKREELRAQSKRVSPVLKQHYTYSDLSKRSELRNDFKAMAKMYLDAGYMETVNAIYSLPSPIPAEAIVEADRALKKADLGRDVADAWKTQCMSWGIPFS